MILSNQVKCKLCGDTPYSAHRHDYVTCSCGKASVDGGMDYLRRAGDRENITEMSIVVPDHIYELLTEAVEGEKYQNTLGRVCNVVRVLRDSIGINLTEVCAALETDDE